MRPAPPVSVHCAGGWAWSCANVLVPAAAVAAVALWALGHAAQSAWWALPGVLSVAAWSAWRLPTQGVDLSWDGQAWQANGQRGRLAVMLDLGPWFLLRLQPEAASSAVWIPVAAVLPAGAWHGLRAALYGPGTAGIAQAVPADPNPRIRPD